MLVYLADLAHTYSTKNESLMIPLNIAYLKAYAMEQHKNELTIKLFKDPNKLLQSVHDEKPDVLGLSNYGWNVDLNLKIGKYIKSVSPKTIFISGGPNLDEDDKSRIKFLKVNDYIDYCVIDGGEEPFSEFISWLKDDKKGEIPQNFIYLNRETEKLYNSGKRRLTKDSKHISSPYLSGYLDEFLDAGMVPLLETNRGCPYRCTFCGWGMASHNIVSKLNIDNSILEVEYIGKRVRAKNWIICDANFGMLKRDVGIAKAIRKVHDKYQFPKTVQMWMSKNTTDRNLEIGEIMGPMVNATMAVQSMEPEVLKNINRDNISLDTYYKYQEKFHALGKTTSSDLIIPLPMETVESHLNGLRSLFDAGVDNIDTHNMRMLAGCEMSKEETKKKFKFKTRFRLIHGDSGLYQAPNGDKIKCFELEESLRSTSTMTEDEVFNLREIHFFVSFAWNFRIYSDLMKIAKKYDVNQLDLILELIKNSKKNNELDKFWASFNEDSQNEWFDSKLDAEKFFTKENNFIRLINQDYEKINIQYSIIILKDYKKLFDKVFLETIKSYDSKTKIFIENLSNIIFAQFPPLELGDIKVKSLVNFRDIFDNKKNYNNYETSYEYTFPKNKTQKKITDILLEKGTSISKVLNTQGFRIHDLKRNFIENV